MTQEVDGANPSRVANFLTHSLTCASRSIADRRNDTAEKAEHNRPGTPFHCHLHAPVAQCRERRASNAEVAGEIPVGSTTDFG